MSTASAGPISGSAICSAAVENLERAVELKPDDPIINDHLGDAYWRVGRTLEAKYQWQQALTLKPEDDQVVTLKQKIADGPARHRRAPSRRKTGPRRRARRRSNSTGFSAMLRGAGMMALREYGRAKLNLTLEVLGRRADGYHELQSLVAFADARRRGRARAGFCRSSSTVERAVRRSLGGDNLIVKAAEAASVSAPGLKLGRFRLIKATARCRGPRRRFGRRGCGVAPDRPRQSTARCSEAAMAAIAPRLGSDVTRLSGEPAGADDRARRDGGAAWRGFPACGVLLANPGLPLADRRGLCRAPRRRSARAAAARRRRSAGLPRRLRAAARLCATARQRSRSAGRAACA